MVRNCLIAAGNSDDISLVPSITALLDDEDSAVRGSAIWALSQLDTARFDQEKKLRLSAEQDPDVLLEWQGTETNAPAAR
jgi:epoxyqueuosine reductase